MLVEGLLCRSLNATKRLLKFHEISIRPDTSIVCA